MRAVLAGLDPSVTRALARVCAAEGFDVDIPATPGALLAAPNFASDTVLVFDVDHAGPAVLWHLSGLRNLGSASPAVVLTASGTFPERSAALCAGANDFLAKPFSSEQFVAVARCLAWRTMDREEGAFTFGEASLVRPAQCLLLSGRFVRLTFTEFALLELLMGAHPATLGRRELAELLWASGVPAGHWLDAVVAHLNVALSCGDVPLTVRSVRGVGFRLTRPTTRQR